MTLILSCTFKRIQSHFGEHFAHNNYKKNFFSYKYLNFELPLFQIMFPRNLFTTNTRNIVHHFGELIDCSDNKINELWALLAWNTISKRWLSFNTMRHHYKRRILFYSITLFSFHIIVCRVAFSFHQFFTVSEHEDLLILNIHEV